MPEKNVKNMINHLCLLVWPNFHSASRLFNAQNLRKTVHWIHNKFFYLVTGASISPEGGIRGNGVSFFGGSILLDSQSFKPKPHKAISVALWAKLNAIAGTSTLFATMGQTNLDGFRLLVVDGRVKWMHTNDGYEGNTFQLQTGNKG